MKDKLFPISFPLTTLNECVNMDIPYPPRAFILIAWIRRLTRRVLILYYKITRL